jgi:magnesium transporter
VGESLTRVYRDGALEEEGFPVARVSDNLERPDRVVWVDLLEPSIEELHELAPELGLHELAVEDALSDHQRPKLDRYATHLFLSIYAVRVDVEAAELIKTEIDAFVNERWLITVRKSDDYPLKPIVERLDRSPDLVRHGVSFLLYGLLDVVVDGYFETIAAFDEYFDRVSDEIFEEHPLEPSDQKHWFQMRRALFQFHRLVVPMREAISSLMRREHTVIPDDLYPYYQDVYDHILRVTEASDALRDLVTSIVETNLSLRDYRQNLIVKKVSSWAAIVAVPALITGYYGMNVPYPGSGHVWGVVASTALIVLASVGLYVLFRRRDWL